MRPVLVTGGAGYIGAHLVQMLLERGMRVRVLDKFLYGESGLTAVRGHPRLEVLRGDICSLADMQRGLRGTEAAIALAALVGDPLCEANPKEAIAVNYEATRVLGEAARAADVKRVIFASSCSVYGASGDALINETSALEPLSVYAKTRLLSEDLLLREYRDVGPVILRLATVFGLSSRMRFDLLVNAMTARAVVEGEITVSNAEGWRPLVHVRDAARAFVIALDAPRHDVVRRRFNVGGDRLNHTISDVAAIVARAVPKTTIVTASQNGDRRSYRVSFARIRQALRYEPQETVAEGVEEIAAVLLDGVLGDYREPQYHNAPRQQRADLP